MSLSWLGAWLEVMRALLAAPEVEPEPVDLMAPPDVIERCDERLNEAGIRFRPSRIPLHASRGGFMCGAEQIVRYRGGPGKMRWGSSPKTTCGLALALGRFETIVQEEARQHLGRPVARIEHVGTYNCREMAAYPGWVSEHSYANAIDIKSFVLRGGIEVSVRKHYGRGPKAPRHAKGRFLRAVARRLVDEGVFSVVLTPAFDGAHRSHFHLDKARYRVDGT